jgi:hypothetical protein
MKVQELRIGNYVLKEGEEIVITSFTFYNIEKDEYSYEPIQLTEEWLLKFGFKKSTLDEDNTWLDLRYGYLTFSSDESVEFKKVYLTVSREDIICEYVHQLQNLYFALTGEELIIKE